MTRRIIRAAAVTITMGAMTGIVACGGESSAATDNIGAGKPAVSASQPSPTVKTASVPKDACGWIPAPEVEAVIGALEGPPRAAGTECVYPLAARSKAFASLLEMRKQFRNGNAGDHDFKDEVRVMVDLRGSSVTGDLAFAAVGKIFAKELGQSPSAPKKADPPPPGWDSESGLPYTWVGRIGHVSISVFSPPEIKRETKIALATLVRDRIPDLPFPADNTYQTISLGSGGKSPCDLLTRSEAEAVLGKLVVDPYRAIENTPHAYEKGNACAYFTAGHRALVITPEWSDGGMSYNIASGIGGLIGSQIPLERAEIEGPWDKGRVDGMTGALMFLKGERSLTVDYLMSAADRGAALKLAAQAMQRLAP
jgi:hypothetical protein